MPCCLLGSVANLVIFSIYFSFVDHVKVSKYGCSNSVCRCFILMKQRWFIRTASLYQTLNSPFRTPTVPDKQETQFRMTPDMTTDLFSHGHEVRTNFLSVITTNLHPTVTY